MMKPAKHKKCRVCKELYTPRNSLQATCSPVCEWVRHRDIAAEESRKDAARTRAERRALMTYGDHAQETQDACNWYVRERDYFDPCISCGTEKPNIQYAAGHYRSVGACPELRFELLNIHKQCNANCNKARSGNSIEYRIRLVKKIGQEAVDWLEGPHEARHYTIEDLNSMKKEFRRMARDLKRSREAGQ